MTRLHHYDNLGTARFVTFACHRKYHLLTNEEDIGILLEEIEAARMEYNFSVLSYVVMPNHVHLVIYPHAAIKLGRVIGEVKSRSARKILERWRTVKDYRLSRLQVNRSGNIRLVFWQRRCYDHNCRTVETVKEKIQYCHANPVRAGFAQRIEEWRWSSYRAYLGEESGLLKIGTDWS